MRATEECRLRRFFRRQGILGPFLLLLISLSATAVEPIQIKIRDLASVEGVRENPLIGYGMIVGLNGTGDKQQTVFAVQTLAGILQRMGVQIPAGAVRVKNVASVFVTANLAPFARPGAQLDVTVSFFSPLSMAPTARCMRPPRARWR